MTKITKLNYKKFTKQNLLPNEDGSRPNSDSAVEEFKQNTALLDKFHIYHNNNKENCKNRERCKRYYFGNQLSDTIPDPDGNTQISEEVYMRKQGITPMSINIIRKAVKAILGVYSQSDLQPIAVARERDEQKLGEMMTIAMEYVYQNRNLQELNTRGCEEFLLSALVAFRVGFDIDQERKVGDVIVQLCDNNRLIFDNNTSGLYFENISSIGYLHDMSLGTVLSKFAHSSREAEKIKTIYDYCRTDFAANTQYFPKDNRKGINFYHPVEVDQCRVIETWTKEMCESLYCHDTAKGEQYFVDIAEEQSIIDENNRRRAEMIQVGGDISQASLIEYEYKIEEKWIVRFLTPNGYVLYKAESPYWHGSHPFVIGAYPLVDGEIHSFVDDAINVQRMVNRLLMRIEYLRMNEAKGLYLVKKKVLEDSGMSLPEFAAKVTSPNAVVALEWEGESPLVHVNGKGNSEGDVQMLAQYMNLLNEITGTTGAMRGEVAKSGTPSSLYAQEAENANNNIADMISWYNGLIRKRDYKIMNVIQQYYEDRRYMSLSGKDYSEESKWYDPDKVRNSKFDLALIENPSSGVFRAQNENLLFTLLQSQLIDLETYLESSVSPFADKMLERVKSKKDEQAQMQQQMQQMQQQAPPQTA
jgi:hypothetical protein